MLRVLFSEHIQALEKNETSNGNRFFFVFTSSLISVWIGVSNALVTLTYCVDVGFFYFVVFFFQTMIVLTWNTLCDQKWFACFFFVWFCSITPNRCIPIDNLWRKKISKIFKDLHNKRCHNAYSVEVMTITWTQWHVISNKRMLVSTIWQSIIS